uniref:Uncharacterized protein n=1 Tax=Rhizophora mucronata TaxID=61149 RepID=A0A2P2PJN7_RHIMU
MCSNNQCICSRSAAT